MSQPVLGTPLPYRNRQIYPVYLEGGGIVMTYSSSRTEAERITGRYGQNSVFTLDNQNYYPILGAYAPNSNVFLPSESGRDTAILNGISNNDLSNAIRQDPNIYQTVNRFNQPTVPDPNQPGSPGGSTPTPTTPTSPPRSGRTVNPLMYPSDMTPTQDKVKFWAVPLLERIPTIGGVGDAGFGPPQYGNPIGPVIMAIQAGISDQNGVDWGPDSVNALDAYIFSKSYNFASGRENLEQLITGATNDIYRAARQHQGKIGKYLAGQAAGLNNVLARTDNVVLNPNMELLFQGPQLRPFSFQFKMSARHQGEANEIKKIIKFFKENMAPKKEGIFLKAPNVFRIKYEHGSGDHPGIGKIKECALTNCSVDYTPLGTYMSYKDGTMVSYNLSLQFQELEPVYNDQYSGHSIGY